MKYRLLLPIVCLMLTGAAFAEVAVGTADGADTTSAIAGSAANKEAGVDTSSTAGEIITDNDKAATADTAPRRGLDLDRLLTGDDEDDLLVEEQPAAEGPASDAADAAQAEAAQQSVSTEAGGEAVTDGSAQAEPTVDGADQQVTRPVYQGRRGGPPASSHRAESVEGPAVIVDGSTINFAQNLQEYRSPRIAMLLSLLVPGLGQWYARNNVKAVAFAATEAVGIGVAAYLHSTANSKRSEAYRFADAHFSIDSLRGYHEWMRREFDNCEECFLEDDQSQRPDHVYYSSSFYEADSLRSALFYTSIGDMQYAPGWIDSDPRRTGSAADTVVGRDGSRYAPERPQTFYLLIRVLDGAGNPVSGEGAVYARSEYQARYNSMIRDAKSYSDARNYVFYALIINHIASAIDAGFTARSYNARLLGQGNSVWERISVEQQYVFTGSEMSSGLALRYKF